MCVQHQPVRRWFGKISDGICRCPDCGCVYINIREVYLGLCYKSGKDEDSDVMDEIISTVQCRNLEELIFPKIKSDMDNYNLLDVITGIITDFIEDIENTPSIDF